jgi:protein-S-isoprenylcysteine O-methyltransferase Ste14
MSWMLADLGTFFFRYRNAIGPAVFLVAMAAGKPAYPLGRPDLNLLLDGAGILVALLGQALRIVTIGYEYIERGGRHRAVFASKLVQGGMFAHCRNPMYLGNIMLSIGIALLVHSMLFYPLVLSFVALAYRAIVATEERYLLQAFGDEYRRYCARVNRWWPRWRGWSASVAGMRFNWRRVLVKEYNTLFVVPFALGLAKLWSDYEVEGASVLPSSSVLGFAFVLWLAAYLGVRFLKKSGLVVA